MASVAMVVSNACSPDPRVMRSARLLASSGHQVTVHAFDRQQGSPMSEIIDGVRVMRYHIGTHTYGSQISTLLGLRAFAKTVKKTLLTNPPDCVYCHDADTLSIGVELKKKVGLPLVFDMHDLQHTWLVMGHPGSILRAFLARRVEKRNLKNIRKADLVVTSSGAIDNGVHAGFREYLQPHGIEAMVVENRPNRCDDHQKQNETKEDWTVGYLGRVREIEPFQLLTQAIEHLPVESRPSIKIAGDGTSVDAVHEHLLSEAPRLGVDLNMSLAFDTDGFSELINDVDVMYAMYNPNRGNIRQGALPVKMFDAASFGVPTLVNSDCLMGEVCKNEHLGGVAQWGNVESIASELLAQREKTVTLLNFGTKQQETFIEAFEHLL